MTKTKLPSSPKDKEKVFKRNWKKLIEKVTSRENYHDGHLSQLEILCDLLQEYHDLSETIKKEGFTFESSGRYGTQKRIHPAVTQKNKVVSEVRQYAKILELTISKVEAEDQDNNEWTE